jgi:hypothetical protein
VGDVEPFLIEGPSQFRSHGPNALKSGLYTREFNEVKELGALNSPTRTDDRRRRPSSGSSRRSPFGTR